MEKLLEFFNSKLGLSVIAIFSGAILTLSFAPFNYYLVAQISLVLLLFVWLRASPGWAFWYGWLFGGAFFGGGIYWVYNSVHYYGNAPFILAITIVALLVAFMSLYPALQGYLLNRIYPKNNWQKFLLAFPASWVILEWIRGWFLSGFPWLFLGYSHVNSPLRGFATIFGVYGVSFVITQTAGAIFCLFYYRKNYKLLTIFALFITTLWGGGEIFGRVRWTKPVGKPVQVSLIQGNISQERKWQSKELWPILNSYGFMTAKNFTSRIIVWPEAAIPTRPEKVKLFLRLLEFVAKTHGTTILSGVIFKEGDGRYYNGILAIGENEGKYYKRHLVPFGEYLPLKFALSWLHKYLSIPMSDLSSGSKKQPDLFAGGILVAPFICYEIAYPALILDYLPKAGVLLTVCDDSWFGESIALAQHLEIARMRALEVGRYHLLCTNTGITAIIDPYGKVIQEAPLFKQAVVKADIKNFVGSTPWVKYGKYLWLPLLLICLCLSKLI